MITSELLIGIKKSLVAGKTMVEIEKEMLTSGWSQADTKTAFMQLGLQGVPGSQPEIPRRSKWPKIIPVLIFAGLVGGLLVWLGVSEPQSVMAEMVDCDADSECLITNLQSCSMVRGTFSYTKEDSGFRLFEENKLVNYGVIENKCVFDIKLLSGNLDVPVGTQKEQIQALEESYVQNRVGREGTCKVSTERVHDFMSDLIAGRLSFSGGCSSGECVVVPKDYPEVSCTGPYFDYFNNYPRVDTSSFWEISEEEKDAINKKCSSLSSLTEQEKHRCVIKIAADTQNPDLCMQLSNSPEASRDNCFVDIAPVIKDYSTCEKIKLADQPASDNYAKPYNYSHCRALTASALGDSEVCRSVSEDTHKNICLSVVAEGNRDTELCSLLPNDPLQFPITREECVLSVKRCLYDPIDRLTCSPFGEVYYKANIARPFPMMDIVPPVEADSGGGLPMAPPSSSTSTTPGTLGPVQDRAVKALMSSLRVEAEQNVTGEGKYPTDLCTVGLSQKINYANKLVPEGGLIDCSVSANGTAWAVDIQLNDGSIFCADSRAYVGKITTRKGRGVTFCLKP